MNPFRIEMLTPEKSFFEGDILSLTLETTAGSIEILAHHAPIVVSLAPSVIRFVTAEGESRVASAGEGFAEVRKDKTVVMCQTMERPEDIEIVRVQRAIEEHERKLREAKSVYEYKMSKATLARAFARLRAKK